MNKLVIIGMAATAAYAQHFPVNHQIVSDIRNKTSNWVAHDVETNPFRNYTVEKIKGLLGTDVSSSVRVVDDKLAPSQETLKALPVNFDWRDQKPKCVHPIRDQGECGACWAFAASSVLSDRFCIATKGQTDVVLSPQDQIQCDHWNLGCNGGNLYVAWNMFISYFGIVSDACLPYSSGNLLVPQCTHECVNGEPYYKYNCSSIVNPAGVDEIKAEIFANGPVETGFTVYEDFMSYQKGVYHYTTGAMLGGHAVKIVGWGLDQRTGQNYWICANSWGESWGVYGYFQIEMGQCGIDASAYACIPKTTF